MKKGRAQRRRTDEASSAIGFAPAEPITAFESGPQLETAPAAEPATRGSVAFSRPRFMSIVQSRWKLIATIALAVTVIGWALAAMQPKRFRASSIVAVVPAEGIDADQVYRGVEVLQYRTVVATIAALASTTVTQRDAIGSEAAGTYSIRATVMPHADLLRFEVEGPDAQKTAAAANRLPVLLSARTAAMYRFYRLSLVAPATTPEEPFYPRAGRAAAAGLIAGLALAFAVAYAFERFQPARR